jgi:MFS family permease
MPWGKRLLADIGPLRESAAFRRLWIGSTLSSVGSSLTFFAVMLQVYDLTRSPLAVGFLGVVQAVPTLAVGLLGGPLTDALDRRKLVLVTSSCLAGVSVALAAQAFAGLGQVWLLYLRSVRWTVRRVTRSPRHCSRPAGSPPDWR